MPIAKYDYHSLREQYIRSPDMSVRELARLNGIPQSRVSSIHEQARKKNDRGQTWDDLRAELQGRTTDVMLSALAKREASRRLRHAEVTDHALEMIDRALTACERDLAATRVKLVYDEDSGEKVEVEEPLFRVMPKDVAYLLDRLQNLLGPMSSASMTITPEGSRTLAVHGPEPAPAIAGLAQLVARARDGSAGRPQPRPVGGGPLPSAPDPR